MKTVVVDLKRASAQHADTWLAIESGKQSSIVMPWGDLIRVGDELAFSRDGSWIRARVCYVTMAHCFSGICLVTFEVIAAGSTVNP
jgi:hypothetical protein